MRVARKQGLQYGVGLGVSAALHLVLVGGYSYVMSTNPPVLDATPEVRYAPPQAMEVIQLPPDGDPAPDGDVDRVLASADVSEPVEIPMTEARVATDWIAVDVDLSRIASASLTTPLQGEVTALPPGAVTAQSTQVMSSIGATGWRPGMYEGSVEHDDHRHALFGGYVLPTSTCKGGARTVTSVNNAAPFGGIRR